MKSFRVVLTEDQLRAIVRALKDQAIFHSHAAESEMRSGFERYAEEDLKMAAELRGLADQLEVSLPKTQVA